MEPCGAPKSPALPFPHDHPRQGAQMNSPGFTWPDYAVMLAYFGGMMLGMKVTAA